MFEINISDDYKAACEAVWTCETGDIFGYDYSDDEKTFIIGSEKYTDDCVVVTITLLDTDTYEVYCEKTIEIQFNNYSLHPKLEILSDGTITLKMISYGQTKTRDLFLYIIEPEKE